MAAAPNDVPKIIHLAKYLSSGGNFQYILLKEIAPQHFSWFEKNEKGEHPFPVSGHSVPTAIYAARKHWKLHSFSTIHCGFRYTLPERDEHGSNALYYQMVASYNSPNGIYFDEDVGHNCLVNFASQEALTLKKQLEANLFPLKFPVAL